MKAALLKAVREVTLEEIPVPEISDDDVLVEVKFCGICGTDVGSYKASGFLAPGTYMGHEFSGVLAKVGRNVKGWKVGDRIVSNPMNMCGECDACKHGFPNLCEHVMEGVIGCTVGSEPGGAFAKYVKVPIPERRLYHLPDEVSFEEGAMVEPLSVSLHSVRTSTFKVGDYTMVLGLGGIGLGVVAFLKSGGAGLIIATEVNEKRAALAKKLGADYVINPQKVSNLKEEVMKLTGGKGINQVFVCCTALPAFQGATDFLKPRGQVIMVGLITQEVPINIVDYNMGEFSLQGILVYSDEFGIVIDLLKKGALPAKQMATTIKLSEIVDKGFNKLLDPNCDEVKVLVAPDE